jgi:hypothetical protein
MFIDREKKLALVTDIAVPLIHNISNTEAQKIIKYENLALKIKNIRELHSSVSITTDYGLDAPWIESWWGQDFLHLSRLALGPALPPVQWVLGKAATA